MNQPVIVSGARTAIGNFGGSLKNIPAPQLATIAIKETLKKIGLRPGVNPELKKFAPKDFQGTDLIELEKKYYDWDKSLKEVHIDEVIIGNVIQTGQGQNPARQAQIYAGIPKEVNSFLINKLCGSSMKAVTLAAQSIRLGDADVIIAGGTENMSAAPYYLPNERWGARLFNTEAVDSLIHDGLWELFYDYLMGMTAENLAGKYNITRTEQDEYALLSNQRAIEAVKKKIFRREIVPVDIKIKNEIKVFEIDEHPRETTMEALAGLEPAFKPHGTVTAGNSSAISDGAAAAVIMSEQAANKYGLKPLAHIISYASAGIDPAYMGMGVVPAINKALKQVKLTINDIDVFEINEAFASQILASFKELGIDISKANLHGSGISLGHPIGCTGIRIIVTLMYEMERLDSKYGLAALCIGGGQGMCVILERKNQ